MATAYVRLRMFWGALDFTEAQASTPGYTTGQIVTGGTAATIGSGVGVRRASLVIDRSAVDAGADPAFMHFDILNTTSGSPDDTWITSDYTGCETRLTTWWTAMVPYVTLGHKFTEVRWHRVGTGVGKPNPAERTFVYPGPINGAPTAVAMPQQACSITFRTGVRKSWGRTYLPYGGPVGTNQRPTTAAVDAIANATNALVNGLATDDMHLVVVSTPLASSLNVERIEVDNVLDVIRRRRWKAATYRKLLP